MTGPDAAVLPAGEVLRNASGELEELGSMVLSLERLVCELVSRDPGLAAARGRELQSFDLLAQRLRGLAGCLDAAAGHLPPDAGLPLGSLSRALPLEEQRRILLRSGARTAGAGPEGDRVELF